ncbi:MAG: ATP-dependent Clp protease proteolytic subunit [Clostridia bacterium]|nr:ATP-dependent Clp protease proteolytic subunit [Clostridia bacterium]
MSEKEKHSPAIEAEKKSKTAAQELENIEKSASVIASNDRESIYCISIIGQVEGHYVLPEGQKATKYEQLIPLLVSIEENDDIDGLLVVLNTMGGDVEAGLALAELISSLRKPTVTLVLGGGHSIGVPLAVAGQRSFIVPSATMTVHPVRINGTVVGAPQTYRYFEDMQNRILNFISDHSRISVDRLREFMMRPDQLATDVGTVLDGQEAVACGLIDEVGGLDSALRALRRMISKKKTP